MYTVYVMNTENKDVVSLAEMASGKMLPFLKSNDRRSYKKYVEREVAAKNILAPVVLGEGSATRFYIPRKNITKLIKAVEKGYSF